MVFLELRWELGIYSQGVAGMALQTRICSAMSGLLSSYEGHLRNLFEAWQGKRDTFQSKAGDTVSLSSCHRDIEIPINIQEESGIITF